MDQHPLVFLAIVIVMGVLQGTVIALQLRTQRTLDQLVEVTSNVANALADLVERD